MCGLLLVVRSGTVGPVGIESGCKDKRPEMDSPTSNPKENTMKASQELIEKYLGIEGLSKATLSEIVSFCEIKTFNANDIIYREHDKSSQLFIVHSGKIDIQYMMPHGKRETVDSCFSGDFLVWSALVQPHETNSIGICRARAELLAFDGSKLQKLCEKDTFFGYQMMSLIARVIRRRLQAARKEIIDLR